MAAVVRNESLTSIEQNQHNNYSIYRQTDKNGSMDPESEKFSG